MKTDIRALLARQTNLKAELAYDPNSVADIDAVTRVIIEQRELRFFADMVAPRVRVRASSGTVFLKGRVTNTEIDDRVGPASAATETARQIISRPYAVDDHARTAFDPSADAARYPSLVTVAERANTCREAVDVQREILTFKALSDTANYDANNRVVVGTNFNWNGGSSATLSTVYANITAARSRVKRGTKIVAVMTEATFYKIQAASVLLTLDAQPNAARIMTRERLAALLTVDDVVVITETYTNVAGAETPYMPLGTIAIVAVGTPGLGTADAASELVAEGGFLCTVVRDLRLAATPGMAGAMSMVDAEGYVVTQWKEGRGGIAMVDWTKVGLAYVPLIVDPSAGAIITQAVI